MALDVCFPAYSPGAYSTAHAAALLADLRSVTPYHWCVIAEYDHLHAELSPADLVGHQVLETKVMNNEDEMGAISDALARGTPITQLPAAQQKKLVKLAKQTTRPGAPYKTNLAATASGSSLAGAASVAAMKKLVQPSDLRYVGGKGFEILSSTISGNPVMTRAEREYFIQAIVDAAITPAIRVADVTTPSQPTLYAVGDTNGFFTVAQMGGARASKPFPGFILNISVPALSREDGKTFQIAVTLRTPINDPSQTPGSSVTVTFQVRLLTGQSTVEMVFLNAYNNGNVVRAWVPKVTPGGTEISPSNSADKVVVTGLSSDYTITGRPLTIGDAAVDALLFKAGY